MKRVLGVFVAVASVAALVAAMLAPGALAKTAAAAPKTTQECNKVKVCVHVVGPWVAVPATGEATFLLECAKRQGSVGGTDVRASSTDIHVWFEGQISAPIMEGTTTGSFLLFHAVSGNGKPGSFEPFLGCIPVKKTSSSRSTVSARIAAAPLPGTVGGVPIDPRATDVTLQPGSTQTTSETCPKKEQLLGNWSALAFNTKGPPDISLFNKVAVKSAVGNDAKVTGAIQTASSMPVDAEAEVQIGAVCTA
jgi:hypothetical protein